MVCLTEYLNSLPLSFYWCHCCIFSSKSLLHWFKNPSQMKSVCFYQNPLKPTLKGKIFITKVRFKRFLC